MDNLNSKFLQVQQVNIPTYLIISIMICFSLFHNSFSETEKEYKYSDGYGIYTIPYNITSGEMTKIVNKCPSGYAGLLIDLSSNGDDQLTITIPHGLIDYRVIGDVLYDDVDFFVLINGSEIDFDQTNNEDHRTLFIPISSGINEIEIITMAPPTRPYYVQAVCEQPPKESKYYVIFPPKKQLANGIVTDRITCPDNLEKIFKPSNNHPICVKDETQIKLVERGFHSEVIPSTKIWVASVPTQATNPWFDDPEIWYDENNKPYEENVVIKFYYEKHGIPIHDFTIIQADPHGHCEAENCSSWETLFLLVSDKDVSRLLDSGFYIVPEPHKKYHNDSKHPKPLG